MTKTKTFYLLLAGLFFLFNACENLERTPDVGVEEVPLPYNVDLSTRPSEVDGPFLIESATITFTSKAMGLEQDMTMYFADYGTKTAVEIKGEFMGVKSHNLSILIDSIEYEIDMITREGFKREVSPEGSKDDINFLLLNEERMKELGLTYKGTKEFLNKSCDLFKVNNEKLKMTGTYLVWKGIALKTDIRIGELSIQMTAKNVDTETPLPPSIFVIPDDIQFHADTMY